MFVLHAQAPARIALWPSFTAAARPCLPQHPLSFSDFLERMKDPAAADLVRNIKRCVRGG